jgi:hypothetical protein
VGHAPCDTGDALMLKMADLIENRPAGLKQIYLSMVGL